MTQTASRTQAQQEDSLARQQQAFDKAIRALKFDRQRRAIELDKSKQKLEKQTAELKELRDDRKHLVIQSPDDGIIYHDKLTRGRLADSPSTLAEASNDPGGDTNNGTGTNGGATNYDNGGDSPGLPNGNHHLPGGSNGSSTDDGLVYGPAPPPDHQLPRPAEKSQPTDAGVKIPIYVVQYHGQEFYLVGDASPEDIAAFTLQVQKYVDCNEQVYAESLARIELESLRQVMGTGVDLAAMTRDVQFRFKHGVGGEVESNDALVARLLQLGLPPGQIVALSSEEKEVLRSLINFGGDQIDKELLQLYLLSFEARRLNPLDGRANLYEGQSKRNRWGSMSPKACSTWTRGRNLTKIEMWPALAIPPDLVSSIPPTLPRAATI